MTHDNLESPRGARPLRGSLSFERATLSRDVARIHRILAACRTSSGNVVRTRRVLTASGKSETSRKRKTRTRLSNHAPHSVAVLASPGRDRPPLALLIRQDSVDRPAETGSPVSAYLNTAFRTGANAGAPAGGLTVARSSDTQRCPRRGGYFHGERPVPTSDLGSRRSVSVDSFAGLMELVEQEYQPEQGEWWNQ